MGAILCCLRGPDDGCCSCLPWPFLDNNNNHDSASVAAATAAAAAARQRADTRVAPVQVRVTLAASSTGSGQEDPTNAPRCPPRRLPYDDPRFIRQMEQRPLVAARERAPTTQLQKSDQLEENNSAAKAGGSSSSLKAQSEAQKIGGTQLVVDLDLEDDCPICLEEYDYENPKMELQCNHNFHLGCIFEWMERSQSCPLCAKVMLFNEDQ